MVQLGAVVTLGVDEDTTHVVAAAKNTDKVNWAAAHKRHIVSPAWLHACGKTPLCPVLPALYSRGTDTQTSVKENFVQLRSRVVLLK